MSQVKFAMIATAASINGNPIIHALDKDGRIWERRSHSEAGWVMIESPQEPEEAPELEPA